MSATKLERDKQKLVQDKCQQILAELLRDDDNKYCVDCDSKGPRWASWNLGIFLCIRCAGIHRNLGVHISKVKSVNLDSWTPEQVGRIQNMGNSKARAVYEANLPDNFSRPQTNSALEKFIRSKYEQKKFIAKEWVETTPKPAFDIETEMKKEKEKRNNRIKTIIPIVQTDIQSNPIPRPATNVNGKTEKVQAKPEVTAAASTDLLGLDLVSAPTDEPFGFFASAETPKKDETVETHAKQTKSLDDEEKDFFSQKVLDQSEEKKLTKESILSLYSQAPSSSQPNGFIPPQTLQTNSLNQFNSLNNKPFGPTPTAASQTNVLASTNPFLANSNSNSGFISTNYQQSSLVQGMSSLQMNPSQVPQIPLNGVGNTQTNLNWFSSGTENSSTNTVPQQSSMANPFIVESTPSSHFDSRNANLFENANIASINAAPNPLLTINSTAPKETANLTNLNNFW